ncbi:MAG: uracil-DNA glycosylase family protein [Candidatus Nezhaarchaeales archaeon]
MTYKLTKLRELLSEMEKCLKCYGGFGEYPDEDRVRIREWYRRGPWFFPPHEETGVKGFFGTGDVCFVCQRPSTRGGEALDKFTLRFYELLRRSGFEDAHVTDIVKCRGLARKLPKYMVENCFPFLLKEISILKPKLIVAVGKEAYKILARRLKDVEKCAGESLRLEYVTHFAYRFSKGVDEGLEKGLKSLRKYA